MRPVAARFWSKVDKAGPVPPHRPELAKGRLARGRRMPHAKLDEATVRAIKRSRGQSQRELAERHGVSRRLIQKIQQGLSWPQVEDSDA